MQLILIILGYLKWHYGKALVSLTKIWSNFLNFVIEFFSIRMLLQNFFDPWKRMADMYPKNFSLKKFIYVFIANSIVRAVGIIMRTIFIIAGIICYIILALLYPIAIIAWIVLPVIIIVLITTSLLLIIK